MALELYCTHYLEGLGQEGEGNITVHDIRVILHSLLEGLGQEGRAI